MNNAPNIRIEVTEGAQIPDPRDRRLLNAWTLAFCVAVVALVTLCATQPEPYLEIVKFLPDGLIITFEVTVLSLLCTLPIGLLTGLGRLSRNPVINLIASTYVEIIRGVPLLVQLFYIYYALGRIIQVPPMVSAVIAISFCYGAYMGEVFRAGILSVPKGQTEAARSLGFNNFQTMTLVILPQAMRTILPPIGNECIAMLKDTSLVSIIAVADLLRRGRGDDGDQRGIHHRRGRPAAPWPRIRFADLRLFRDLYGHRPRIPHHHPAALQRREHDGRETHLL